MTPPCEPYIVCICDISGKIWGAGFLVHQNRVLTCAHVVAKALSISSNTDIAPSRVVYVSWPLLEPGNLCKGNIVFWQPSYQGRCSDIAAIEIYQGLPATARPARMMYCERLSGHPFSTMGFPNKYDDGIFAYGKLQDRHRNQTQMIADVGYRIVAGFSGAPVWSDEIGGVVGMVVQSDLDPAARAAFMIPTEILGDCWQELQTQRVCPEKPYQIPWPLIIILVLIAVTLIIVLVLLFLFKILTQP